VTVAATVSAVVAATVAAIMQLDHLINMLKHGGGCNAGKNAAILLEHLFKHQAFILDIMTAAMR